MGKRANKPNNEDGVVTTVGEYDNLRTLVLKRRSNRYVILGVRIGEDESAPLTKIKDWRGVVDEIEICTERGDWISVAQLTDAAGYGCGNPLYGQHEMGR